MRWLVMPIRAAPTHHEQEDSMTIKAGDLLPDGTLTEFIATERPGCTVGPNAFTVSEQAKDRPT